MAKPTRRALTPKLAQALASTQAPMSAPAAGGANMAAMPQNMPAPAPKAPNPILKKKKGLTGMLNKMKTPAPSF